MANLATWPAVEEKGGGRVGEVNAEKEEKIQHQERKSVGKVRESKRSILLNAAGGQEKSKKVHYCFADSNVCPRIWALPLVLLSIATLPLNTANYRSAICPCPCLLCSLLGAIQKK